jgi:hypothetical protein
MTKHRLTANDNTPTSAPGRAPDDDLHAARMAAFGELRRRLRYSILRQMEAIIDGLPPAPDDLEAR